MWLPCLLFLLFLHVGSIMNAVPDSSVIQTPANVTVEEGSTVNMQCRFNGPSTKWSIKWYKVKGNEQVELLNSSLVHIFTHLKDKLSNLTLKSVDLKDTGTYLCNVIDENFQHLNTGTNVTIIEITDFEVNQTSGPIHEVEGADVTIECRFRTVGRNSSMYVSWDKDGLAVEQANKTGSYRITQNLRAGFASLTLTNATVSDSGLYVCNVGREPRNQTKSSGIASHVVITTANLSVIQSPAFIQGMEGQTLIINCSIAVAKNVRLLPYSVTWYKNGTDGHEEEVTGAGRTLSATTGLASLILPSVQRNDSGMYRCAVGSNGRGNGTMVTISERDKQPETDSGSPGAGIGAGIGAGAGGAAGILLLLLLLSVLAWRYKKRAKESTTETEAAATKEAGTHLPLTSRQKELTYASLRFNKKEVEPDAGVIYAEVRRKPKQRAGNSQI
uniref:cell adhesion molecule-related/down-regulated by oncogenes-like isoform X1 n=1 Tax=Podarcis muralis TaxID=64176 RepID=UPI00109F5FD0|nr:cell adhesion molecule-related/down-regulated by oncogenes-like isoform X1 [Podarcis muralis]